PCLPPAFGSRRLQRNYVMFLAPMKSARKRDGKEKPGSRRAECQGRQCRDPSDRVPKIHKVVIAPRPAQGRASSCPPQALRRPGSRLRGGGARKDRRARAKG